MSMAPPKVAMFGGSHQPKAGERAVNARMAKSTAPKKMLHRFCTGALLLAGGRGRHAAASARGVLLLLPFHAGAVTRAVDLGADLGRQHRRVGQRLQEVDQVPPLLGVRHLAKWWD